MSPAAPSIDDRMSAMPGVRESRLSTARSRQITGRAKTPARFCTPRGRGGGAVSRLAALVGLLAIFALCIDAPAQAAISHPYTGISFGPGGVGSGAFQEADGVAVDQNTGDVFVLDKANEGRVFKFDAAGKPVDFSTTGTNVIEGVGSAGNAEEEIAVDSSTGPDAGDIYVANNAVVRIYDPSGAFRGELSGGEMCGVAVGPSGDVYVGDYPNTVKRYAPTSSPITNEDEDGSMEGLSSVCNIAVDKNGNVYAANFYGTGVSKYDAMEFGSLSATGSPVDGQGRTLAVDSANEHAFIDETDAFAQYNGSTEPPSRQGISGATGEGALEVSFGLAVNEASEDLYAANGTTVEIFGPGVTIASATTQPATNISESEATVHATVEPSGTEVTGCAFEYGATQTSLAKTIPCTPAPPYTGAPTSISAHLTGLQGSTRYYYRVAVTQANKQITGAIITVHTTGPPVIERDALVNSAREHVLLLAAINPNGVATESWIEYGTTTAYGNSTAHEEIGAENPSQSYITVSELKQGTVYHYRSVARNEHGVIVYGEDGEFATVSVATLGEETPVNVQATSATLETSVNAEELSTTYYYEYGTTTAYGSSTSRQMLAASAGADATLTGLLPQTAYDFRIVVENSTGVMYGPNATLTTAPQTIASFALPDDRGYEKVSPSANADGDVYQDATLVVPVGSLTNLPFAVASDGNAVAYVADPSETGGTGHEGTDAGNEYLATRTAMGGWSASNINPPPSSYNDTPEYQGFTEDLSTGFLVTNRETPLISGALANNYRSLYARNLETQNYAALLPATQPDSSLENFSPEYAGSSQDGSHVLITVSDALASGAHYAGPDANNLYDSHAGTLTLVNVLPDGSSEANATFGGPTLPALSAGPNEPALAHDISVDGSRVFWTDLNTNALYVRENDTAPESPVVGGRCVVAADACTALIAENAQFWDATPDGSKVLYSSHGDLYEYDLESGSRTDTTPGAEMQGVVGASQDLSYVYFVGDGALAPGATAQHCTTESSQEEAGQIARKAGCNLYVIHEGDASPRFIATLSAHDIDNYPNSGYAHDGDWVPGMGNKEAEVTPDGTHLLFESERALSGFANRRTEQLYIYDFSNATLSCVSCNATGQAAAAASSLASAYLPPSRHATYLPRWMSDDGARIFFDSLDALVPRDTNNETDVYEWERDGSGSCTYSPGCIYLISDGTSQEGSYLIGSTSTGDDVFFTTRGQLVDEDENEDVDVYDARVGAVAPPASPQCSNSCQGVPSAPPVFATPPSVTFAGLGNYPAAAPRTKAAPSPLSRAQKLIKALRGCRAKPKRKRAACEAEAHKQYGPTRKAKASTNRRAPANKTSRESK
jgi:hypothetical protein